MFAQLLVCKDYVIVIDIAVYENFDLASEFISMLISRLSGQDYVYVVAKSQVSLQSSCFGGHLARATPSNLLELKRFIGE